jgi:hypothetical protein
MFSIAVVCIAAAKNLSPWQGLSFSYIFFLFFDCVHRNIFSTFYWCRGCVMSFQHFVGAGAV